MRKMMTCGQFNQLRCQAFHLCRITIITKLTGMSALEYGKAKLFGPLGINDLSWGHDPQGISNGGKDCTCSLATWRRLAICTCETARGEDDSIIIVIPAKLPDSGLIIYVGDYYITFMAGNPLRDLDGAARIHVFGDARRTEAVTTNSF